MQTDPRPPLLDGASLRARVVDSLRFHPREAVALAVLGLLLVSGAAVAYVRSRPAAAAPLAPVEAPSETPTPAGKIVIHIVGAIRKPGVYPFAEGARVVDAVRAAGGFVRGADRAAINLARKLIDGEQIVVPRRGETSPSAGATGPGGSAKQGGKININLATASDLTELPGIGDVLAQRIVDYREQHGPFRDVRDLMKVPGIGDRTFKRLEPYVVV